MINLEEFVQSIHMSTAAAGEALIRKNMALLDQFFEEMEDGELSEMVAYMAAAGGSDSSVEDPHAVHQRGQQQAAEEALRRRRRRRRAGDEDAETPGYFEDICVLKPKMVALQYPVTTREGPGVQFVHVPLISIVPLSQVQLKEMSFKTELELGVSGDSLQVSFPKRPASDSHEDAPPASKGSKATLEVKISAMETPDGLRHIVEGYERALRAQVPG